MRSYESVAGGRREITCYCIVRRGRRKEGKHRKVCGVDGCAMKGG